MTRRLATDERALWARVIATVNPLHGRSAPGRPEAAQPRQQPSAIKPRPADRPSPPAPSPSSAPLHRNRTLDAAWDRRLGRGLVQPDMVVDLHGRTLQSAYAFLDSRLEQAVASGARMLLLITGKPPQDGRRPVVRGAIRAAVDDWLAASRHSSGIAAVRAAHPRHGGDGALYIVLRRATVRHRQNS